MSRARQVSKLIGASNTAVVSTPATFSNTVSVAASGITFGDSTVQATAPSSMGFKNKLINGRLDVWQRGTTGTGSGYLSADRWFSAASGITFAQVANDRDSSIPYAVQVTADGNGYGQFIQRIEDVRTLAGQQATLSFWAKSPSTGVFRLEIGQNFGSGGSTAVYPVSNTSQFNMAAANTWQFFTATVSMPSVSGKTIGAGSCVQIQFGADSGIANRVMTFSEVQFEKGPTATAFDHRPIGMELMMCQRYYEKIVQNAEFGALSINGAYISTSPFYFKQTKRAAPTISTNITNANYSTHWGLAQAGYTVSSKSGTVGIGTQITDFAFSLNFTGATFSPTPIALRTGWASPYAAPEFYVEAEL